jgi:hypothetical protein
MKRIDLTGPYLVAVNDIPTNSFAQFGQLFNV